MISSYGTAVWVVVIFLGKNEEFDRAEVLTRGWTSENQKKQLTSLISSYNVTFFPYLFPNHLVFNIFELWADTLNKLSQLGKKCLQVFQDIFRLRGKSIPVSEFLLQGGLSLGSFRLQPEEQIMLKFISQIRGDIKAYDRKHKNGYHFASVKL